MDTKDLDAFTEAAATATATANALALANQPHTRGPASPELHARIETAVALNHDAIAMHVPAALDHAADPTLEHAWNDSPAAGAATTFSLLLQTASLAYAQGLATGATVAAHAAHAHDTPHATLETIAAATQ